MTKKKANPQKAGRKSGYKTTYNIQAEKLAKLGATDKELAEFFDIDERTLNRWKKDYPKFCQSLKKGKCMADAEVANSLYRRAIGYSAPDTKFATFEGKITDSKKYIKHYPPEPVACIFWLKNRQRSKWRDKPETAPNNNDNPLNRIADVLENDIKYYQQADIQPKEDTSTKTSELSD